mmetsp:Transcript_4435/g.10300  ORF Transcript_4435/g.10300 Transcript_4435/m.10300 type:complete len:264 (-) Transcript_4435:135-926(-)
MRVTRRNCSSLASEPVRTRSPSINCRMVLGAIFPDCSTWKTQESVKQVHLAESGLKARITALGRGLGGGFFTLTTLITLPSVTFVSLRSCVGVSSSPSTKNFRFSVSPFARSCTSTSFTCVSLAIVVCRSVSPERRRTMTSTKSGSLRRDEPAGLGQLHSSGDCCDRKSASPMWPLTPAALSTSHGRSPPGIKQPRVFTSSSESRRNFQSRSAEDRLAWYVWVKSFRSLRSCCVNSDIASWPMSSSAEAAGASEGLQGTCVIT